MGGGGGGGVTPQSGLYGLWVGSPKRGTSLRLQVNIQVPLSLGLRSPSLNSRLCDIPMSLEQPSKLRPFYLPW